MPWSHRPSTPHACINEREGRSEQAAERRRGYFPILFAFLAFLGSALAAADLEDRTSRAYDAYAATAREAFLSRIAGHAERPLPPDGKVQVRPGTEDGIVKVPGGLVHDWIGTAYLADVTLQQALDVSVDYPAYQRIYKEVLASTLLGQDGDAYRVLLRIKESGGGLSAVLDLWLRVQYVRRSASSVYVVSLAESIRQVVNAGRSDERRLDPGHDSGYLWRATTLTGFTQLDSGVVIEMETLGLSRRFPRLLGWFIEPIARRLGRKSVEASLEQFCAAVREAAGQ